MPEESQVGVKINAKTHPKSITKLIIKKIRKIIKNHDALKGKIIEKHWKTNVFDGLESCMCERERNQKTSKHRPTSNRKSMNNRLNKIKLEKGVAQR